MPSTLTCGRYDLELREGKTYRRTMTWRVDDQPVDLTGMTVRAAIRATPESDDVVLALTQGAGITNGGATGTIDLEITDTQAMADLAGVWDLSVTYPNGDDVELLAGRVQWDRTATR